jgi:hypothetical protein
LTAKILVALAGLALVVFINVYFFPRRRRARGGRPD